MKFQSSRPPELVAEVITYATEHSIAAASRKFGIPKTTISNWLTDNKKISGYNKIRPKIGSFSPASRVLVIPDMHHPWCHPDALEFLKAVRSLHKPTHIVCLGDEIDAMAYSRYPKDPDAPSAGKELEEAIASLEPFYREFPNVMVCESNHTIRPWKKAFEAGLPASFLPTISKVLRAPDGWIWRNHWELDGVFYHHGDMGVSGFSAHMLLVRKRKQNSVIGHLHSFAGVNYEGPYFGMNTGCLIDTAAICFKYAKNLPIPVSLGCGIVIGGRQAHFIPMMTGEDGRWINRL